MLKFRWRAALVCSLLLTASAGAQADNARGGKPARKTKPAIARLDPVVLRHAMEAVNCAQRKGLPIAQTLGVIDFRLPSTEPRLWVIDLNTGNTLFEEYVAHGRGSGDARASRFSNVSDSYTSSLGLFRTLESYDGANGYSLRLQGLEPGINDRAFERAIVIHGADYVSEGFIKTSGRLGRSYGCPAVRREIAKPLIDSLRENQYVYAYADDLNWKGTQASLGCGPASGLLHTANP